MPESSSRSFGALIITGLISLAVGVGGGLILNYLTDRRPELEYAVITSDVFSGKATNLAIVALEIRNTGRRELESLESRIMLRGATLDEHKIGGLPPTSYKSQSSVSEFLMQAPHLNPDEVISIQLLLSLDSPKLNAPTIEVRAKGVAGLPRELSTASTGDRRERIFPLLVASLGALLSMTTILLRQRSSLGLLLASSHRDDQREVFAFVLSINELHEEAQAARSLPRELSYWSHADYVTERCLEARDPDKIQRGMKALRDLMNYASIAPTSCLLINFDIARMAAALGDEELVREHLRAALKGNSRVVRKRIQLDDKLSGFREGT